MIEIEFMHCLLSVENMYILNNETNGVMTILFYRQHFFTDVLDKLKVQSQNGKGMFPLSQVAEIKLNDSMFVIDLRDSPEVHQCLLSTFYV